MNDVQCVLWAAQMLILDEDDWCRRTYAMSAAGADVPADSDRAICWCARGAVHAIGANALLRYEAQRLLSRAVKVRGMSVGQFNDMAEHAEVIRLFDEAIDLACSATSTAA